MISVPDAPEQRPHVYVGMRVQLRPSEDRFYKNLKHVHESMKRNDRFVSPSCSFCTSSSSSSSSSGILTCDYCAEMETEAKMFLKFAERGRLNLEVRGIHIPQITRIYHCIALYDSRERNTLSIESQVHAAVQSRKDCDVTIRLCVPTREENTMTTLQMLRFLEWNVRFDTTMQRRSFSFMRNAMKDWKSKFGSDCAFDTFKRMSSSDYTSREHLRNPQHVIWNNKNLNERQRESVLTFLFHRSNRRLPTIVFGPPGMYFVYHFSETLLSISFLRTHNKHRHGKNDGCRRSSFTGFESNRLFTCFDCCTIECCCGCGLESSSRYFLESLHQDSSTKRVHLIQTICKTYQCTHAYAIHDYRKCHAVQ